MHRALGWGAHGRVTSTDISASGNLAAFIAATDGAGDVTCCTGVFRNACTRAYTSPSNLIPDTFFLSSAATCARCLGHTSQPCRFGVTLWSE